MSRWMEITGFLLLSAAAHAGLVSQLHAPVSAGEGRGGEDALSVTASAAYSALAQAWRTPPDVSEVPAPRLPTLPASDVPVLRMLDDPPGLDHEPFLPMPLSATLPQVPDGLIARAPRAGVQGVAPGASMPPDPAATPDIATTAADRTPVLAPPPPSSAPQMEAAPEPAHGTSQGPATSRRPGPRPDRDLAASPPSTRPAPQPAPPSAPQSASSAAGGSGGATTGATGQDAAPSVGQADPALIAQWGGRIAGRIQSRVPRISATGAVTLQIAIAPDGRLLSVAVLRSSGNPALDQAGVQIVRSVGRFPRAPRGLNGPSYTFNVPLQFT